MCTLILECGMVTVSWYAELALRRRASMSATGSVMVMAWRPSPPRFPWGPSAGAVCPGGGGSGGGHVQGALPVHVVGVDLVEHKLLGEAEGVVPPAVELLVAQPAEVTGPGQGQGQQPVAELPQPRPAERDVRADRHAFPELELGHRLPRPGDGRLLPGDDRQVLHRAVDQLGVPGRLADAHVHHDLGQAGDLHDVGVAELLAERRSDLGAVTLLEPRRRRGGGAGPRRPPRLPALPLARACGTAG